MPVSNKWSVGELLKSCREYAGFTKRRISFEYILINGVNDSEETAKELDKQKKNLLFYISCIHIQSECCIDLSLQFLLFNLDDQRRGIHFLWGLEPFLFTTMFR
jgi:hypothetical protein